MTPKLSVSTFLHHYVFLDKSLKGPLEIISYLSYCFALQRVQDILDSDYLSNNPIQNDTLNFSDTIQDTNYLTSLD